MKYGGQLPKTIEKKGRIRYDKCRKERFTKFQFLKNYQIKQRKLQFGQLSKLCL